MCRFFLITPNFLIALPCLGIILGYLMLFKLQTPFPFNKNLEDFLSLTTPI